MDSTNSNKIQTNVQDRSDSELLELEYWEVCSLSIIIIATKVTTSQQAACRSAGLLCIIV